MRWLPRNKFRKDLIYRVNTVEITLPPLRQRGEDIVVLAEHFAAIYAKKYNKPVAQFEEATLKN
jgi:DNA-binding NtrC family response regulator